VHRKARKILLRKWAAKCRNCMSIIAAMAGRRVWGLVVLCGLAVGGYFAGDSKAEANDVTMNESAPVRIGGLEFVVATQAEWIAYKNTNTPVRMELRITNRGTNNVIFPTMDTSGPRITTPDGKDLRLLGGRTATMFTPPIAVEPGKTIIVTREVAISWSATGGAARFTYADGTGLGLFMDPMAPGSYELRFWLEAAKPDPNDPIPKPWIGNGQMWIGKGETKAVTFTVKLR
jgi:hypothetical protein